MRLAVDEAGAAVGFAAYLIQNSVAELEDLFVDPAHMRRGIGDSWSRTSQDNFTLWDTRPFT